MKVEYLQCLKMGNSLLEVINPSNGESLAIISILEYNTDVSSKELIVRGIDMTTFFQEQKYIGGNFESFQNNLFSYLEKNEPVTRKFSSHFPFTVYTSL